MSRIMKGLRFILSCLQANKLPCHRLIEAGRRETFGSEILLLVLKTLSLRTQQAALASCAHWFLLLSTGGGDRDGEKAGSWLLHTRGASWRLSNYKLRKASMSKGLRLYLPTLTPEGNINFILFMEQTSSLPGGKRHCFCLSQPLAVQASLQRQHGIQFFSRYVGIQRPTCVPCSPSSECLSLFPFQATQNSSRHDVPPFFNTTVHILQTQGVLLRNHRATMRTWKSIQYCNAIHGFHPNFASSSTIYLFPFLSKVSFRIMYYIFTFSHLHSSSIWNLCPVLHYLAWPRLF